MDIDAKDLAYVVRKALVPVMGQARLPTNTGRISRKLKEDGDFYVEVDRSTNANGGAGVYILVGDDYGGDDFAFCTRPTLREAFDAVLVHLGVG